ncbi:hypothetical protein ACTMU2_07645 [Cupriavidus basilensis]
MKTPVSISSAQLAAFREAVQDECAAGAGGEWEGGVGGAVTDRRLPDAMALQRIQSCGAPMYLIYL